MRLKQGDSRLVVALFVLSWGLAGVAGGDPPDGVKLLRPDSLAGWTFGKESPVGWTIRQGELWGDFAATRLLSGWTFAELELSWRWRVEPGGVIELLLPDSPRGPGLRLLLREGAGCGALADGNQLLSSGGAVEPVFGDLHAAKLTRRGDKLRIQIDQRELADVTIAPQRRFGLGLAVAAGRGAISEMRVVEPAGERLFNGQDLSGWWTPGNKESWTVVDGAIVGLNKGGNYLRSEKEFGNFTLSFVYKTAAGVNSGIGIRTPRAGWPSGDGMELQIYDHPGLDKHSTMAIYGNVEPLARADRSLEWNRVTIKADGRMISAWVNDELAQMVDTSRSGELRHRNLQGWIGIQDHGGEIAVKDIQVLEAPAGQGLDAWREAAEESLLAAVVNRVMNSERLACWDGCFSKVAAGSLAPPTAGDGSAPTGDGSAPAGEQTAAEMTGPGVLVRAWHSSSAGKLLFYFDDESTPRLEAPVERLHEHLPLVGEDRSLVLTAIPFAKKLRIALRDGQGGDFRYDYVAFPAGSRIESFRDSRSRRPRGLLSAINYRYHQLSHGTHREHDPYPRFSLGPQTIIPGGSAMLARLDGGGLVHWLKLQADPALWGDDRFWLEIAVDGESAPAISAPARYLFPALRGAVNHPSFVMTYRNGATSFLAMPFSAGLTVTGRNFGPQPVTAQITLSVEPAGGASRAGHEMMRLRGVFTGALPAAGGDLVSLRGRGRWVGIVYHQPEGASAGIAQVEVDGQSQAGWARGDLSGLFGLPADQGDFFTALSGRDGRLAWRYFSLEPIEFSSSLTVKANPTDRLGDRLILYYLNAP